MSSSMSFSISGSITTTLLAAVPITTTTSVEKKLESLQQQQQQHHKIPKTEMECGVLIPEWTAPVPLLCDLFGEPTLQAAEYGRTVVAFWQKSEQVKVYLYRLWREDDPLWEQHKQPSESDYKKQLDYIKGPEVKAQFDSDVGRWFVTEWPSIVRCDWWLSSYDSAILTMWRAGLLNNTTQSNDSKQKHPSSGSTKPWSFPSKEKQPLSTVAWRKWVSSHYRHKTTLKRLKCMSSIASH